jgi:hypothetical protein
VVELSFSSCGREAMLSPPWQWRKPPWDALGENPYGALPLVPHQFRAAPSGRCSCGAHPNSPIEVCVKSSGLVVGCNSFSACDAQVTVCGFLDAELHMKVVKSLKMKPHEVTLMEFLLICIVH